MDLTFDNGGDNFNDDRRPGRPISSKTCSNIERVQTILGGDRLITLRELEERVGISKSTLHSIITEDLEMSKVTARWVPKLLRKEQKREGSELAENYCQDTRQRKTF